MLYRTGWYPYCYNPYQNLLPTPIVSLKVNGSEDIYIAPDIVELINVIEPAFREYYDSIGLNYKVYRRCPVVLWAKLINGSIAPRWCQGS